MKRFLSTVLLSALVLLSNISCVSGKTDSSADAQERKENLADRNLTRAITILNAALDNYFEGSGMVMHRYFNPYQENRSSEIGSIWMYASAIEAVTAVMESLKIQNENGDTELYSKYFEHFKTILGRLYDGSQYYKGTFTLVSYTQTATWHPYAVNRASVPGEADVNGILNVYDDQMWLVRQFIIAYRITGDKKYLDEAEALTAYLIDGWDATLDDSGEENGGITWGPGYVTKHSCSNGPLVSPLVWLSGLYQGKSDEITVGIVEKDRSRAKVTMKKSDCYLEYATKIYKWQKSHLLNSEGVYDDFMGGYRTGDGKVEYETLEGVRYRKNTALYDRVGPAYSYNSGTMLSGAADLYRATEKDDYRSDLSVLSDASFSCFAKLGTVKQGLYTYDISGFRNWFNGVLLKGFVDSYDFHPENSVAIDSFQNNLDFAWTRYLYKDMLPPSLLAGWNIDRSKNNVEGLITFAFAAEYAVLAGYKMKIK